MLIYKSTNYALSVFFLPFNKTMIGFRAKSKTKDFTTEYMNIEDLTVVCLVAWPLNESEARVDLVIELSLLFLLNSTTLHGNSIINIRKAGRFCIKARSTPVSLSFRDQSTKLKLKASNWLQYKIIAIV